MELNVDAHLWCLGAYGERYVPGGYFEELTVDQQLEIMSKIEGLTGLFVFYPFPPMPKDPDKLVKKLDDFGLKVSNLAVECWGDRKWKYGAFSTNETAIRKEAIKMFKDAIDLSKEIGADSVLLWPAHDGFDYPFQADYGKGWKNMVDTVAEICNYDTSVKIALEAKSKDPRQKQYISNTGKALIFINDVGAPNLGAAIDVGHSLMAGENLAESVALLDAHKRLYQVHLNENYKDADPDLIFGTINFWELLEFFYHLGKTDFSGWSSIDIIVPRDDREKSLRLGVKLIWKYKEMADRLLKHQKDIDENMKGYHFADNMDMIVDLLF
jgi:xylose isomerase